MHYKLKQKAKNKLELFLAFSIIVAMLGISSALSNNQSATMQAYAIENDCTWSHTGTAYGDNRDYICK